MESIAFHLSENQNFVINGILDGHQEKSITKVNQNDWIKNCQELYLTATHFSSKFDCPIYFLGYSLGATVFLSYLQTLKSHKVKKMILLAPALCPHFYFLRLSQLLSITPLNCSHKSSNLEDYRAKERVHFSLYRAFYHLQNIHHKKRKEILNIPTKLFCHEFDELINYQKTKKYLLKNSLGHWSISKIDKDIPKNRKSFKHLIIDKLHLGDKSWNYLKKEISLHFSEED